MTGHRHWRGGAATASIVLALAVAGPLTARVSDAHGATRAASPAPIIFTFGRQGGNIRPLTVTIDSTGAVKTSAPAGGPAATVHLSPDALDGVMKLARAEGFFTMPAQMIGHGLPDIGGRFITIRTAGITKTVSVRFVHNAAFDQLFAVLSAVSGIPQ